MPASPCGEDFIFQGRLLEESNTNQYCYDKGGVVVGKSTIMLLSLESSYTSHSRLVPPDLRE